jgi:hypothetical protein
MHRQKRRKWTDEELALEALKYTSRGDFVKYSRNAYAVAHRRGLLNKICSHMIYVKTQWTNEMLRLEALKYTSKTAFANGSRSAYFTAINRGILDKICLHMKEILHYWTEKELHLEALKYNSRGNFQKYSRIAYGIAWKRGSKFLDKICSHMRKSCGVSAEEKELLSEILKFYSDAKKLRKTEIEIENRHYIKGFDADIFVPSLMKAIEFDGTYHHSYAGPKRGRPWWPEEALREYHEIKDNYFLSIGISILHIKEKDWNLDKEACIQKCLSFLRGDNV